MSEDSQPSPLQNHDVVASYVHTFCKPEMRHIYRQISGLRKWRAHVLTHKWENRKTFHLHKRWITILSKYRWRFFRRLWYKQIRNIPWQLSRSEESEMLRAAQTHSAKVLHIYFGHMAMHLLPLIKSSPMPVVVSFHGADAGVGMERPAWHQCMLEVFEHASAILARSESLLNELVALGCPKEKLHLSRTAIPMETFTYMHREFPEDGRFIWLQACRLIEKKGLSTTLHAFAKFKKSHPKAVLQIAGDGPMKEAIQEEARSLGIEKAVRLIGFLPEPQILNRLSKAHFFVHPSQTGADGNVEGVPNSLLEAMATGLPSLATNHGGIPEAIENGVSGVIVAERDANGLAEAALKLTENPEAWKQMGIEARKAIERKFSPEAQRDQLEGIYTQLVEDSAEAYHRAADKLGLS